MFDVIFSLRPFKNRKICNVSLYNTINKISIRKWIFKKSNHINKANVKVIG